MRKVFYRGGVCERFVERGVVLVGCIGGGLGVGGGGGIRVAIQMWVWRGRWYLAVGDWLVTVAVCTLVTPYVDKAVCSPVLRVVLVREVVKAAAVVTAVVVWMV